MATISLSPSNLNLEKNTEATILVNLDTNSEKVLGTDLVLNFDPEKISIISVNSANVFQNISGQKITSNKVYLSLSNGYQTYFSGKADIAEIKIKSKDVLANSSLNFDFTPGSTTDTNVVIDHGQDILSSVFGSTINLVESKSSPTKPETLITQPTKTIVFPQQKFVSPVVEETPQVLGTTTSQNISISPELLLAKTEANFTWPVVLMFLGSTFLILTLWAKKGTTTTNS